MKSIFQHKNKPRLKREKSMRQKWEFHRLDGSTVMDEMNQKLFLLNTDMIVRLGIGRIVVDGVMCSVSMFGNWSIRLQW